MHQLSKENPIGIGRTAEIYAWQDHQVVKLFHTGFPAEWVEYEMAKARKISDMDLPTPKLIDLVEIDGRRGLVYERVDGVSMLKLQNQRPWSLFRMARQLAELQAVIHAQDGTGFPPLRSDQGAVIQAAESLPGIPADEVAQVLNGLPDGHALCHFDFHPDQVMITTRGPVILDWATARQGHPLADVARTTILLKIGQVPYGGRKMEILINLWRMFYLRTYLARYFELHPHLSRKDLAPWLIPIAIGRLGEGIPGEQKALMVLIDNTLAALGIVSSRSKRINSNR